MSKTDFVIKLISFSRKSTSNKTKYLEVQKKLNPLTATIYITSNDGSHNIFIHHPTPETFELKKTRAQVIFLYGN